MFSRFQVIVFGIQVLNKSYTTFGHVKKILRSLPFKFRPKVTVIHEAKYFNILSLESLINNLQSHEMELNIDEPVKKSKSFAFKYSAKSVRSGNLKKILNQKLLKKTRIMRRWSLPLKDFNTWPRRRTNSLAEAVSLEDKVQEIIKMIKWVASNSRSLVTLLLNV